MFLGLLELAGRPFASPRPTSHRSGSAGGPVKHLGSGTYLSRTRLYYCRDWMEENKGLDRTSFYDAGRRRTRSRHVAVPGRARQWAERTHRQLAQARRGTSGPSGPRTEAEGSKQGRLRATSRDQLCRTDRCNGCNAHESQGTIMSTIGIQNESLKSRFI